ncbi:hypothetical protein Hanom_Chr05g00390301 [Helianthus anomalus]
MLFIPLKIEKISEYITAFRYFMLAVILTYPSLIIKSILHKFANVAGILLQGL